MRLDYPVASLCRSFDVSHSGFYIWLNSIPSERAKVDERLKLAIAAVHKQSRETYGPLRMQPELAAQAYKAGRYRIIRLRRVLALRCRGRAGIKLETTHKPKSNMDLTSYAKYP